MRVLIDYEPFAVPKQTKGHASRGVWPAKWIRRVGDDTTPWVSAYRCRFELDRDLETRIHVSADERYELFLDGKRLGRGPERGVRNTWFFESYDLDLEPGAHTLVARVWALGDIAPFAQISVAPGFVLAPEGERALPLMGTGVATWEALSLGGYHFIPPDMAWGTGHNVDLHGDAMQWGWETGADTAGDWGPTAVHHDAIPGATANGFGPIQLLTAAMLPAMRDVPVRTSIVRHVEDLADLPDLAELRGRRVTAARHLADEVGPWQALLRRRQPLTLPAHTSRRLIIDLDDYYCAYPELVTSGGAGAYIRLHWAESLFTRDNIWGSVIDNEEGYAPGAIKANRNDIADRLYIGTGDSIRPDGGENRRFTTLWWQAGRYVELVIRTADQALTLHALALHETGYPLEQQSKFSCDDPRLGHIMPIAWRCLQACSHETFMDCPYYEQLMYVGDTRLEALTAMVCGGDTALPRKAVRMFDQSRFISGLTQSRFPSRNQQIIPPFSLWWVSMVRDYALWRNDLDFVRQRLPGVRAVLDYYLSCINADGFLEAPNGWNFMDWVKTWPHGIPPEGQYGVSGLLNWHFIHILGQASELETWLGDKDMAARYRRHARELVKKMSAFWDTKRGLWADDLSLEHFSEHTQCMALLSGNVEPSRLLRVFENLVNDPDLARTTIYFSHYLLETFRLFDRMEHFFNRMQEWFDLDNLGLRTLPEHPGDARSDCHAWGAHPLFHYYASILGIRPACPGFQKVTIYPRLGHLREAKGRIQHPNGELSVEFVRTDGTLTGMVTLPPGVTGTLVYQHVGIPLESGQQPIAAHWGEER